jgi:hypothetical protein
MNNETAKREMVEKLTILLETTSKLKVRAQLRLRILKEYIYSQLLFELKTYEVPLTWIDETLDALCTRYTRDWLETPISSCVREVLRLPINKLGFNIPSLKDVAEKIRLVKRNTLRHSPSPATRQLWKDTSLRNINIDEKS